MQPNFDVIIVGSGPAGVSAAFPLVEAGIKVLMVDGGLETTIAPLFRPFLTERLEDEKQWQWMLGKAFYALKKIDAVSPKLRVPSHKHVFQDFIEKNNIEAENFIAVGSLAKGGLSNAWGAAVACLSDKELLSFPFPKQDIERSYETIVRRIGISGTSINDDLSDYFKLDKWSLPPISIDIIHSQLLKKYLVSKSKLFKLGFLLGHSRIAVLSKDYGERKACDILGNCLWGCHRKAIYSASGELPTLLKHKNFYYKSGFIVEQVNSDYEKISVETKKGSRFTTFTAKKLVLAAGTLATTRLALLALKLDKRIRLQSSPTAAFLLWMPRMLGIARTNSFGLGQLSFSLKLTEHISGFGSTFSTAGIPVAEFARHFPLRTRHGIDLLRQLLSSCLVGNLFLPGQLSTTTVSLNNNRILKINGSYSNHVPNLMKGVCTQLRKSYRHLNTLLPAKSFTIGKPGSDIHYAASLPMRSNPALGETTTNGEVVGLKNVYVVDGACLTTLSEKPPTLTIMANADRIAREIFKHAK